MFNVYPYSGAYGIVEELRTTQRVNSRTRINNQPAWKDSHTMQTPLLVLDAHIQAVNTNRLQQARLAELVRLAQQGQSTTVSRIIATIRRSTGSTLVSIGQWLQRENVTQAARELEAMSVTNKSALSSR